MPGYLRRPSSPPPPPPNPVAPPPPPPLPLRHPPPNGIRFPRPPPPLRPPFPVPPYPQRRRGRPAIVHPPPLLDDILALIIGQPPARGPPLVRPNFNRPFAPSPPWNRPRHYTI